MASDISVASWTGLASCALSCGCFALSWVNDNKARQIQSARPVEHLGDLKELLPLLPLLVAVSGKAWTTNPIKCELSDQKVVHKEITETEHSQHKAPDGSWRPQENTVRRHITQTNWGLKDGPSSFLAVANANDADSLYLPTLGDVYIAAENRTTTPGMSGLILRSIDVVQGFKVSGHHKVEKGLLVGTQLTAIGEVCNAHPMQQESGLGSLVLQSPHNGNPFVISDKPLRQIVKSYQEDSSAFKAGALLFGGLALAIFGTKAAMFGWSKWRDRRIRLRREEADQRRAARRAEGGEPINGNGHAGSADGNAAQGNDGEPDDADRTCVVCLERRSNTVFQACGHMCTCSQCSSCLNRCPICRTRTRAIRVYHA